MSFVLIASFCALVYGHLDPADTVHTTQFIPTHADIAHQRPPRSSAADDASSWKHDRYQDDAGQRRGLRNGSSRSPLFFPQDKSESNEVKPTGKLTIENLHYDVSEQELERLFGSIGPVTKAYIKVSLAKTFLQGGRMLFWSPR